MALGWMKKLFGGEGAAGPEPAGPAEDYKGYQISPAPMRKDAGWLTSGVIAKDFPEGRKEHRFIRADTHQSQDEAAKFALMKARQIIDEQGDRVFREG